MMNLCVANNRCKVTQKLSDLGGTGVITPFSTFHGRKILIVASHDTAGEFFDKSEIVGGHYHGGSVLRYCMQSGHYLLAGVGVEIAGRLVGRMSSGRLSSARAMAIRCCSPPESSCGIL